MVKRVLIVCNAVVAVAIFTLVFSSGGGLAGMMVFLVALLLAANATALFSGMEIGGPSIRLWRIWSDWLVVTEADLSVRASEIRQLQKP